MQYIRTLVFHECILWALFKFKFRGVASAHRWPFTQGTGTWRLLVWYMSTIASEYGAASFVRVKAGSRTTGSSVALVPIYPAASRWILVQLTAVRPTQDDDKGTVNRVGLRRLDRGSKLVPATAHEFRCGGGWWLVSEWVAWRKARENCHNTVCTFGERNLWMNFMQPASCSLSN
jgi:hypothetical protein